MSKPFWTSIDTLPRDGDQRDGIAVALYKGKEVPTMLPLRDIRKRPQNILRWAAFPSPNLMVDSPLKADQ